MWHQESGYFVNYSVLLELSANNIISGSRVDVEPFIVFGMLDEDTKAKAQAFSLLRVFLILWIAGNSIATMRNNRSLNELFSSQTLYGMYNSVLILGAQFYSLISLWNLQSRPFGVDEVATKEVVESFWMFSSLSADFRDVVFLDSACVLLCVANVIMHFRRKVFFINLWLNALQTGAPLLVMWSISWQLLFTGVTLLNMAMFGNQSLKYKDFWNATIYSFYAPGLLANDTTAELYSSTKESFMLILAYILFYFIMAVYLLSSFMAVAVREHVFCEMTNFEPAVDGNGNYVHET